MKHTPPSKIVSVQMDGPLLKDLAKVQAQHGFSLSVVIRLLTRHGLKHLKSLGVGP